MTRIATPIPGKRSLFHPGRLARFGGITQIVQLSHGIFTLATILVYVSVTRFQIKSIVNT
jgi:hypothetical protein